MSEQEILYEQLFIEPPALKNEIEKIQKPNAIMLVN